MHLVGHMEQMVIVMIGILVGSIAFGQNLSGGQYKFRIPNDQELESVYGDATYALSTESAEDYRASSFKRCPAVSKLIFKIFDRIVEANGLRESLEPDSPVFKLDMRCLSTLSGGGSDAGSNSLGLSIPASIVEALQSEDEIAFMLGHEMSHVILKHYKVRPESRRSPLPEAVWVNQTGVGSQTEKEADGLGTILVANSGYDPRASHDGLCNIVRTVLNYNWMTPCALLAFSADNVHGTVQQRTARIEEILTKIGYPESPRLTVSKDLENARLEFDQIKLEMKSKK